MKHFHCPVNGWDCPYYKDSANLAGKEEHCLCSLENPMDDCDDFFTMWCGCEPDEYTDD